MIGTSLVKALKALQCSFNSRFPGRPGTRMYPFWILLFKLRLMGMVVVT